MENFARECRCKFWKCKARKQVLALELNIYAVLFQLRSRSAKQWSHGERPKRLLKPFWILRPEKFQMLLLKEDLNNFHTSASSRPVLAL